jgi:hypothetical protein
MPRREAPHRPEAAFMVFVKTYFLSKLIRPVNKVGAACRRRAITTHEEPGTAI